MKMKNKCINGYMTIEAGIYVPIVFIVIITILYYSFYLYNHCVVYQSCYIAGLRGSNCNELTNSEIEDYVNQEVAKLLDEQIFQYQIKYKSNVSISSIQISAESAIKYILKRIGIVNEESLKSDRSVKVMRTNPVMFIRICGK